MWTTTMMYDLKAVMDGTSDQSDDCPQLELARLSFKRSRHRGNHRHDLSGF
jgi:hypothetical protein